MVYASLFQHYHIIASVHCKRACLPMSLSVCHANLSACQSIDFSVILSLSNQRRYNCLELIKHSQLEKYHQATSQEERDAIETNPYKILHGAMENARPLLKMVQVRKGAVLYRVPVPG